MATIKDIAKLSGYSIGTVSRVINNRSDVSAEAREKIGRIILEQNFQPNANAKMLKQFQSSEVTVIVRGVSNTFLETVLEAIQRRMRLHGESVNVIFLDETANEVETASQILLQNKPKGFIFLGGSLFSFKKGFSQINVPSVLVTGNAEHLGFGNLSSFSTDDYEAAGCAARKLLEKGHRRIGIVGGYPVTFSDDNSSRRMEGAVCELKRAGIVFNEETDYMSCSFSMKEGYRAAAELLRKTPDLTAVFAVSDLVALGVMRAAADLGMSVPGDLSVIGFDGIDYTQYAVPRLATIRQNTEELARNSVEDLLLRINYPGSAVHRLIPYEYMDGESVGTPRRK